MNEDGPLDSSLMTLNPEWETQKSQTIPETLTMLKQEDPFDAIVLDTCLSDIANSSMLREITHQHPKTLRFVLTDFGDGASLLNAVGSAHHCLSKPVDSCQLKEALEQAFELNVWLTNEAVHNLLSKMHKLPSPPTLYFKVIRMIQSPNSAIDEIGDLIAQDIAMTAKLLQLVNSAVFALQRRVTSAQEAVMFLGLDITKSMILLAHTFSYFDKMSSVGFSIDQVWKHSILVANFSRSIAKSQKLDPKRCEEAFTAGMLHDIGKLLMAANIAEQYSGILKESKAKKEPIWETERNTLGVSHAELGATLLAVWGLPMSIVEAVALHHNPMVFLSQDFSPLAAVHVANALAHSDLSQDFDPEKTLVSMDYLEQLEVADQVPEWYEICQEAANRDEN